ncbi:MAG TPA: DUF5597 domain-containing protein [Acidisarcina sp.]
MRRLLPVLMFVGLWAGLCAGADMPRLDKDHDEYHLIVDGKPYLIVGAQVHNSSGWPDTMAPLWPALNKLSANTVMIPVYWEQLEPQPDTFDYSVVDGLLAGAREHHLHLALLWFGTWKNGGMTYTPSWVKDDPKTYPRVQTRDGLMVEALSPLGQHSWERDGAALSKLMSHLKEVDGDQHTVILVQVENEAGVLGSDRDYSPEGDRAFAQRVPDVVLRSLGLKTSGTWEQVFSERAPEAFMAYHTAKYFQQVASAGKAAYPLPFYINVWPREQPGLLRPGYSSPSGGAVAYLLPMWKALAPAIDIIGVDNYDTNPAPYFGLADLYSRPDNPLFIPETGGTVAHAKHMFEIFARPSALGISCFGYNGSDLTQTATVKPPYSAVAIDYALVGPAAQMLLQLRDAHHLQAAIEEDGLANVPLLFDRYDAVARFGPVRSGYGGDRGQGNTDLSGRVLIGQIAPDEFLVIGVDANVLFAPKLGHRGMASVVSVEEGSFVDGMWQRKRLLNGDETYFGLELGPEGTTLRVKFTLPQ